MRSLSLTGGTPQGAKTLISSLALPQGNSGTALMLRSAQNTKRMYFLLLDFLINLATTSWPHEVLEAL